MLSVTIDEDGLGSKGISLGLYSQNPGDGQDPHEKDMTAEAYLSDGECGGGLAGQLMDPSLVRNSS